MSVISQWLEDPLGYLLSLLPLIPALLPALILHEVAHGYTAYRLGDPTAKMLGRLSLNPLRHLDLRGTLCMFLIGLGWARGSDAAYHECWKYKAAQADTVCIVHGVNDIRSGKYGTEGGDSAEEIIAAVEQNIRALQKQGIRVILFTVPPFEYPGKWYMVWKTLRYAYPALAKELGVELFDFSGTLDARPPYGNRFIHGAHPDGEGGRIAAEALLRNSEFRMKNSEL